MGKFNKKLVKSKTTNLAGGSAYRMGSEMELIHAVLTTFLEDKYYEKGADRVTRIKKLISENKPQFVANLAVIARKEFNLRSVSHLLIAELSKIHRGDDLIKKTIVASSLRVDDLTEIVSASGLPIAKQVKRGVRNALLKFNRYQLAKYKGEGNALSLVDLFNLTHPKVKHADKEQKKAWKDLMEGNLKSFDTWETELSNAKDDAERTKKLETLIKEDKIGYMALLRNINNFIKYGINDKSKKKVIAKLTDVEEIAKSKQLPFRFTTAYENIKNDTAYADAISEAMDIAVSNTPEFKGNTLIAVDVSGSMKGNWSDSDGAIKKASIFAATLLKSNKNAEVVLYDGNIRNIQLSTRTPVIDLAKTIEDNATGGSTNTGLVFGHAATSKKEYDRIIILSDNESWSGNAQVYYTEYKKQTGQNPFVYAVDIQGYGTKDLSGNKIFHLTGWSDRLLDFIGQAEKGETLVDYIRDYEIMEM